MLYFNRHGQPINAVEWGHLIRDRAYCVIAQAILPHPIFEHVCIETSWVGAAAELERRPMLFVGMIQCPPLHIADGVGLQTIRVAWLPTERSAMAWHRIQVTAAQAGEDWGTDAAAA